MLLRHGCCCEDLSNGVCFPPPALSLAPAEPPSSLSTPWTTNTVYDALVRGSPLLRASDASELPSDARERSFLRALLMVQVVAGDP